MNKFFKYGGVNFEFCQDQFDRQSSQDNVVVLKDMPTFEQYAKLLQGHPINILELGIFEGGSAILLALMLPSAKIVAVDSQTKIRLDDVVRFHGLQDRVKLYHGVLQQDRGRLQAIIKAEFGDEPIDFVLDDASHMYEWSRQSFEILFPFVRQGGHYALEDWNWAHYGGIYQTEKWTQHPALTNLVFDLVMLAGSGRQWAAQLQIQSANTVVEKGAAGYQPAAVFQLNDHIRNRGKTAVLI